MHSLRRARLALLILALAIMGTLGTGCATRSALPGGAPAARTRTAKVFFATDRRQQPQGPLRFGPERTDPPGLHMGWEAVAVEPAHRVGKVDAGIQITPAFEQTESAAGPAVNALRRTDAEIAAFLNATLRPALRAASPPEAGRPRQVLLYVHGFNTSFDYAVRKTGQLTADLGLLGPAGERRGVSLAYCWPARGGILSYLGDEESAEWTQQRLAPLLQSLARVCQEEHAELCLVAHSMGARALIRSLADLANACPSAQRPARIADHVILLAPDIGKGLFDQYVERFLPLVGHLTIYVSSRDGALSVSRLLHGHGRLGLLESTVLTALELTGLRLEDHRALAYRGQTAPDARVDMVDVSGSFASEFGHSYEDPGFIADLRELIFHDTPAGRGARANLEPKDLRPGLFRSAAVRHMNYFRLRAK